MSFSNDSHTGCRMNRLNHLWNDAVRATLGQRLRAMGFCWLAFGAGAGLASGVEHDPGVVGVVAHMIAGLIVYGTLGLVIGLFSGRARESLIGGLCGLLVGVLMGLVRVGLAPTEAATLGLVMGGLIGATCWPFVRGTMMIWRAIVTLRRWLSSQQTT